MKSLPVTAHDISLHPDLQDQLKNMTYRDMKKAAIVRGMKPRHVIRADFFGLLVFLANNWFEPINEGKLIKYDQWTERKIGPYEGTAKSLRMSYIREDDMSDESLEAKETKKALKAPKKKSKPRVKNDYGIVSGTKKEYVYELVKKGRSTEKIIRRTIEKFPDAKENSIKIWISKAKKLFKEAS